MTQRTRGVRDRFDFWNALWACCHDDIPWNLRPRPGQQIDANCNIPHNRIELQKRSLSSDDCRRPVSIVGFSPSRRSPEAGLPAQEF